MLLEQSEPKKGDRKSNVPIFDSAVPLMRKARTTNKMLEEEATVVAPTEEASGLMKFMLLTKKGNKPQVSPATHCVSLSPLWLLAFHSPLN